MTEINYRTQALSELERQLAECKRLGDEDGALSWACLLVT